MILTESNVINHYLLDHYDKNNILSPATEQDKYLVDKYLGFQSSTQAPFYAQVSLPLHILVGLGGSHLPSLFR